MRDIAHLVAEQDCWEGVEDICKAVGSETSDLSYYFFCHIYIIIWEEYHPLEANVFHGDSPIDDVRFGRESSDIENFYHQISKFAVECD